MNDLTATAQESEVKRRLFQGTSHSPSLADLVGYQKAKKYIDFCFIANPYYPTRKMLKDLQAELPHLIKTYPSSNPYRCQKNLAQVLHVNPDHLLIGNGATELIALIDETLIKRIAIPIPTFGEYIERLRNQRDAVLYTLDVKDFYHLNLEDYAEWIRARGLKSALVINPGNPTGQVHSRPEMQAFLGKMKGLDLVIADESFIDFAADDIPSLLPVAERYSNLLIIRSMSKHCGVPGLRLGYCYTGNERLLERIRRFIPTWNVNTVAEYFLSLLPPTDKEYHIARRRLIRDVAWLRGALQDVDGIRVYPTGSNFVLLRVENGMTAAHVQAKLLRKYRMYVRDCSNKIGMDRYHIRVTSQGREKDAKLVEALKAVMQQHG